MANGLEINFCECSQLLDPKLESLDGFFLRKATAVFVSCLREEIVGSNIVIGREYDSATLQSTQ
jgi:hypothetical protein